MIFFIFNFLVFLAALGLIIADIFLFVKLKANIYTWAFLIVGAVLLVVSAIAFKLRRSIHLLGFYCLIIFGAFLVQLIVSILFIVAKEKLINKVLDDQDFKNPEDKEIAR
jgi:Tetraspanin family